MPRPPDADRLRRLARGDGRPQSALTAIFTPGYAAAEQMTAAKQGPWTDIYGLSATLYHAITGAPPPSAFDRMLDDACKPLGRMALQGFGRGLLAGIDAGLAVRALDRPQSIARLAPDAEARRGSSAVESRPWRCRASRRRRPSPLRRRRRPRRLCRRGRAASVAWPAAPWLQSWCWRAATTPWSTTGGYAADGGCAHARLQGRAGCPACGGSAAAEGPRGARPFARRERATPQDRAGGSPAQAGRGRDAAQDRGRDGRRRTSGRRPQPGRPKSARKTRRGRRRKPGRPACARPRKPTKGWPKRANSACT